MTDPADPGAPESRLLFYATPEHACSYLPGRDAVTVFADPAHPKTTALYGALARHGFRRSGRHLYVPRCPHCSACVPVRLPVRDFRPRRRHRRVRRMNEDLSVRALAPGFRQAHFDMYCRYQQARHRGGGMDHASREQYLDFLVSDWCETVFFEFSLDDRPLAVAVVDVLPDALSAVYTFFEPSAAARAPGVNAVLFQVDEAVRRGLRWLYLGYWVGGCRKMDYKREYLPQERLVDGEWRRHEQAAPPGS